MLARCYLLGEIVRSSGDCSHHGWHTATQLSYLTRDYEALSATFIGTDGFDNALLGKLLQFGAINGSGLVLQLGKWLVCP